MNGIKMARIKRCTRCQYVQWTGVGYEGPNTFRKHCAGGEGGLIELNDDFMEGPVSNCPADYWSGLEPVGPTDPDEWKQWNKEKGRERRRQKEKAPLKQTVQEIARNQNMPLGNPHDVLEILVASGAVPEWLAQEVDDEL